MSDPLGPVRWWLPLTGLDPEAVRVEALHAALSWWLEEPTEHRALVKPYSLSPISVRDGLPGVEVVTLSAASGARFVASATAGAQLRLDRVTASVAADARPVAYESWASIGTPTGARRWRLDLHTPTTIRSAKRFSPMPRPESFLRRLSQVWEHYSGLPACVVDRTEYGTIWVSEIDGETVTMRLNIGARDSSGHPAALTVAGFVGHLVVRCDEPVVAHRLDVLLRTAAWCGVGSLTEKGLGVVGVRPHLAREASQVS